MLIIKSNIWKFDEKNDEVIRCSFKCEKDHEHFMGPYESALIHYKGVAQAEEGKKEMKNIVIFHQLSDNTLTKTSSELYYILLNASKGKEYWINPNERSEKILEILEKCKDDYLIKDDDILYRARRGEGSKKNTERLYKQENWERMVNYSS